MANETNETPSTAAPAGVDEQGMPRVTINAGTVSMDAARSTDKSIPETVSWVAKEYIAAEKNAVWYTGLAVVVVAVIILDFFVLKAWTVSFLILAIAAVLIAMSVRPSRDIQYKLTQKGLYIGEQFYDFADYKAFGVTHDGKENSILLIPVKRFRPGLSVYFPLESGEQIVDLIGQRLSMQEIKLDFVDQMVRMLRL
ncbi:hypothetical protein GX865_00815 [Candidatus Saccharibacteria bacterium]|jgi:uncharacterized membrane protein YobD (UPF0266 family)|nr:hypothetical protein [Candidatus Saccharibacteria bacterium]